MKIKGYLVYLIITFLFLYAPLSLSATISSFGDSSLSGAAIIDFDGFTENVYLNDFSVGSVNFHNQAQYGSNYFASDAFLPGESGRHIGLYGEGYITFNESVSSFAFLFGALNSSWHIEAVDSSGVLIESIDILTPACCGPKVYGIAANDMRAIRLFSDATTIDAAVMDNFHYVTPVPLPPAIVLFASGLFFLLGIKKKKTNSFPSVVQ